MFTDGITLPVDSSITGGTTGDCVELQNSGRMRSMECWKPASYVCMANGKFFNFLKSSRSVQSKVVAI